MSISLKGWTCKKCRCFNGEEKGLLLFCRWCEEPRPADLEKLEAVLTRPGLTPGQRGLLGDMQRAVEQHGIALTPGQAGMVRHILDLPAPARKWTPPRTWRFWSPIAWAVGLVLAGAAAGIVSYLLHGR